MQITYPCLLPLFLTGFESSQTFLFDTTLGVPFPFFASRVSKDFPVLSLWFSIMVGGITVRVFLFWFKAAVLLIPPPVSAVKPRLVVAESDRRQTDSHSLVHFRLPTSSQNHRGWLSQSSIALLHLVPFGRGFYVLMNLWGSFREQILLFPVFVLFCWRLLLLIFLFRWEAFMEGMFNMVSTTKILPWNNSFLMMPSDVVMKPGISLASTSSFKRRIMRLRPLSIW